MKIKSTLGIKGDDKYVSVKKVKANKGSVKMVKTGKKGC